MVAFADMVIGVRGREVVVAVEQVSGVAEVLTEVGFLRLRAKRLHFRKPVCSCGVSSIHCTSQELGHSSHPLPFTK